MKPLSLKFVSASGHAGCSGQRPACNSLSMQSTDIEPQREPAAKTNDSTCLVFKAPTEVDVMTDGKQVGGCGNQSTSNTVNWEGSISILHHWWNRVQFVYSGQVSQRQHSGTHFWCPRQIPLAALVQARGDAGGTDCVGWLGKLLVRILGLREGTAHR